jgi:hypothetical protein
MHNNDKTFLARAALILFIAGITMPFIIAIFASESIAIGFGLVTEVLALILGVISWKHLFGKIVSIGVCILIAISGVQYIAFLNLREDARSNMQTQKEAQQNARNALKDALNELEKKNDGATQ